MTQDGVNSPSHYFGKTGLEARQITHSYRLGPDLTQAFDYVVRAGRKTPDPRKDLEKAVNYLLFAANLVRDRVFGFPATLRPTAAEVAEDFDLDRHRAMAVERILAPHPSQSDCLAAAEALQKAIEVYAASAGFTPAPIAEPLRLPIANTGNSA